MCGGNVVNAHIIIHSINLFKIAIEYSHQIAKAYEHRM